jgi:hypothetical protein
LIRLFTHLLPRLSHSHASLATPFAVLTAIGFFFLLVALCVYFSVAFIFGRTYHHTQAGVVAGVCQDGMCCGMCGMKVGESNAVLIPLLRRIFKRTGEFNILSFDINCVV